MKTIFTTLAITWAFVFCAIFLPSTRAKSNPISDNGGLLPPAQVRASQGTYCEFIWLTWEEMPDCEYQISRSNEDGSGYIVLEGGWQKNHYYTDRTAEPNRKYHYAVQCRRKGVVSGLSSSASGFTRCNPTKMVQVLPKKDFVPTMAVVSLVADATRISTVQKAANTSVQTQLREILSRSENYQLTELSATDANPDILKTNTSETPLFTSALIETAKKLGLDYLIGSKINQAVVYSSDTATDYGGTLDFDVVYFDVRTETIFQSETFKTIPLSNGLTMPLSTIKPIIFDTEPTNNQLTAVQTAFTKAVSYVRPDLEKWLLQPLGYRLNLLDILITTTYKNDRSDVSRVERVYLENRQKETVKKGDTLSLMAAEVPKTANETPLSKIAAQLVVSDIQEGFVVCRIIEEKEKGILLQIAKKVNSEPSHKSYYYALRKDK